MIQKYTKKPVEIEAIQFEVSLGESNFLEIINWVKSNGGEIVMSFETGEKYVKTLEGNMLITEGDYIIKGVKGEFYPCKPDIFEMTYDKVEEEEQQYDTTTEQEKPLVLNQTHVPPRSILFYADAEEMIKVSEGKFYFKGEEVEDKYQVYERFNEWLTQAEMPKPRWSSKWDQMK